MFCSACPSPRNCLLFLSVSQSDFSVILISRSSNLTLRLCSLMIFPCILCLSCCSGGKLIASSCSSETSWIQLTIFNWELLCGSCLFRKSSLKEISMTILSVKESPSLCLCLKLSASCYPTTFIQFRRFIFSSFPIAPKVILPLALFLKHF